MGLYQTACHANPDQEHCQNDQDGHEEQMVVRPWLVLIPMDFPGNFEVTGMTKHDALLSPIES